MDLGVAQIAWQRGTREEMDQCRGREAGANAQRVAVRVAPRMMAIAVVSVVIVAIMATVVVCVVVLTSSSSSSSSSPGWLFPSLL
jgi:hypothetical protein